jgi:hypothetical protein
MYLRVIPTEEKGIWGFILQLLFYHWLRAASASAFLSSFAWGDHAAGARKKPLERKSHMLMRNCFQSIEMNTECSTVQKKHNTSHKFMPQT